MLPAAQPRCCAGHGRRSSGGYPATLNVFNRSAILNIRGIGHHAIDSVWRLGYAARFFALTIASSGTAFRRFRLIVRELYYTGVLSLGPEEA